MLCIAGGLLAVIAMIRAFFWNKKEEQEHNDKRALRPIWILFAVILGIAGIVVFLLTEDTNNRMIILDVWTIVNAAIFIAGIICVVLGFKLERAKDNSQE